MAAPLLVAVVDTRQREIVLSEYYGIDIAGTTQYGPMTRRQCPRRTGMRLGPITKGIHMDKQERGEEYRAPELEEWGSVADLTQTGLTRPGDDEKAGSRPSRGQ
jgi:hypothetical protein